MEPNRPTDQSPGGLPALYDDSLPHIYGYLLSRCGTVATAEDLTSETFLAAADAVRRDAAPPLTRAWLIGVARHKLADHWRRQARDQARIRALTPVSEPVDDPWDEVLDRDLAWTTLNRLSPQHRGALTLRYVDDLTVPRCAEILGRTVHATEALLVRARAAFRSDYCDPRPPDDAARPGGDHHA